MSDKNSDLHSQNFLRKPTLHRNFSRGRLPELPEGHKTIKKKDLVYPLVDPAFDNDSDGSLEVNMWYLEGISHPLNLDVQQVEMCLVNFFVRHLAELWKIRL